MTKILNKKIRSYLSILTFMDAFIVDSSADYLLGMYELNLLDVEHEIDCNC